MIKIFFFHISAMLLLVVSLSLCWTMSTRAKNSRSHGYLYDMLSMIFWFVWGEDTGVVTRLDIYHLAGAGAGSWWYWHCDCDQDQDQEDHYYWDFVNTSGAAAQRLLLRWHQPAPSDTTSTTHGPCLQYMVIGYMLVFCLSYLQGPSKG